jgi:probable F420-dependent oxidoreductase
VKFGLNLINFGPAAAPESLRGSVEWAESVGLQLVMISDHVAITPDVGRAYPAPFFEPFTTLAWLAGLTRTIELGTTVVIVPYRHPLLTARMIANIDQFSQGRLIFGVGSGWARAEFEALGVPFHQRGRLTDDFLSAMKTHWTNDLATFESRSVAFREVQTLPRPVRRPHPPIWVGGHSPAAIRRTAIHGDAWHPLNVRLDWLAESGLPLLRAEADRAERPLPVFAPRIKVRLADTPLDDAERRPGQGTLDQVRDDLAELERLGAEYVVFDTYHGRPEELSDVTGAQRTLDRLVDHAIDPPRQMLR